MTATPDSVRILAIDHEEPVLLCYEDALCNTAAVTASGFPSVSLTCCQRDSEAIAAVERASDADARFAVIFLDLMIGELDRGVDVGARIREMDPMANIVAVTSMPKSAPETIARRIAPVDRLLCLHKPLHPFDIRQVAAILSTKWQAEQLLHCTNAILSEKDRELAERREALLMCEQQLARVDQQLLETNDALSELARNLERARKASEKKILHRTRTLILPVVERLLQEKALEKHRAELEMLRSYVMNLFPGNTQELKMSARLSATESRIAAMIRTGMSTEAIARNLYISVNTVKTHRKNIRRKLDLQNSGHNLRAWLDRQD